MQTTIITGPCLKDATNQTYLTDNPTKITPSNINPNSGKTPSVRNTKPPTIIIPWKCLQNVTDRSDTTKIQPNMAWTLGEHIFDWNFDLN